MDLRIVYSRDTETHPAESRRSRQFEVILQNMVMSSKNFQRPWTLARPTHEGLISEAKYYPKRSTSLPKFLSDLPNPIRHRSQPQNHLLKDLGVSITCTAFA